MNQANVTATGVYFHVRCWRCLQFDYRFCEILESGDAQLLAPHRCEVNHIREDDDCWEGFTDVVNLATLICRISGMTPRECHKWVSGADTKDFGVDAASPCQLWFTPATKID